MITANNNSQGKSTLAKSILWTFGCEPLMDSKWKEQECIGLINFTIDGSEHQILRDGSNIFYRSEKELRRFHKITGEYSDFFASLVGFTALLPAKRKKDETSITLQTPPPSYYFLPFYIDQDKGWNDTWEDFQNLQQYANWKQTIVKAHTGYINRDFFEQSKEIAELKESETESIIQLDAIDTTLSIIDKYVPSHNLAIEPDDFTKIEEEIRVDLNNLIHKQEILIEELSSLQSENHYLSSQFEIASIAIKELESDYIYATEYLEDDFECPLCGVAHKNTTVNRASLLKDKSLAEERKSELLEEMNVNQNNLNEANEKFLIQKAEIKAINKKYSFNSIVDSGLLDFVDGLASRSVQLNVKDVQTSIRADIQNKQAEQNTLKKEQGKLSKLRKEELDERFQKELYDIKLKLNVHELETSKIKSPIDYQKVKSSSGGSADRKRVFLAYNIAVYNLITFANVEVIAPMIIDTPNQQEQAESNYESILNYFHKHMPDDAQIFVCAMPNPLLSDYENEAKVIKLDDKKLLSSDSFEDHSIIIDNFISLFNEI